MQKSLVFLFILIAASTVFGQNYVSIFRKDLPQDILKYYSSDVIDEMIIRDANLNPALMYWRINYLNEVVAKKNTDPKKNGYNYLSKLAFDNYKIRKEFIDQQLLIAEKMHNENTGRIKEYLSTSYQNSEMLSLRESNTPVIDTNKINYIIVKYYTRNGEMVYEPATDYSFLRKSSEKELLIKLQSLVADIDNTDKKVSDDDLKIFIDNWVTIYTNQNSIDNLATILNKYYNRSYSINNLKHFSVFIGESMYLIKNAYSYNLTAPGFVPIKSGGEGNYLPVISVKAGYKYLLKNTISFMSYLDFGFIGRYGKLSSKSENDQKYYNKYDVIDNDNFSFDNLKAYNINVSSSFLGLYFKTTTPILVFSRDFIIEFGVSLGANLIKTNNSYLYDYSHIKITYGNGYNAIDLGSGMNVVGSDNVSINKIDISPLFEVNYSLLKPVIINFTIGLEFAGLSAGLEF